MNAPSVKQGLMLNRPVKETPKKTAKLMQYVVTNTNGLHDRHSVRFLSCRANASVYNLTGHGLPPPLKV